MMPVPDTLVKAESPRVVSAHVAAQLITSSAAVTVVDARGGDARYREQVKGSVDPPSPSVLKTKNVHTVLVYDSGTSTLSASATPANLELTRLHAYGLPHIALCLVQGGLPAIRSVAPHLVLPPVALPPRMAQFPWAVSAFRAMHAQYAAPAEILPGLFVGAAVHASNPYWLSDNKVTHILAVGEEFQPPLFKYPALSWSRIPVKDHPTERLAPSFANASRFIDDALKQNGVVFVHCLAGASRSIATVAAYLISHGWLLDDALAHLKAMRFAANPNPGFVSQLRQWESVCLNNTQFENPNPDRVEPPSLISFSSNVLHTNVPIPATPISSPITPHPQKSSSRRRCDLSPEHEPNMCNPSSTPVHLRECGGSNRNDRIDLELNDVGFSDDEDNECFPSASLLQ